MLISYHEALQRIQTHVEPLHVKESVPLLKSLHRVASHDIFAHTALPKYAMSLKEGYGVAYDATMSHYTLLRAPYPHPIPLGQGVVLCTGDAIPLGISAIIAEEEVVSVTPEWIEIPSHVTPFTHMKKEGEDIHQGEMLVAKGERIGAQKITALASQSIETIEVFKKPTVSILSIGAQLIRGEIANSNAMSLAARAIELGCESGEIVICDEDETAILKNLEALAHTCDVIITTGALSRHDSMCRLLESNTLQSLFRSVRISPSKPTSLSFFNQTPLLHLPGLPLGCMLGFEMLGVPLLRHLQSLASLLPPFISCTNQKRVTCKTDSMSAIPGYCNGREFVCAPYYEAGRLNILSQCNGYILSEDKEIIKEGEAVPFFFFTYPPVS